MKKTPLKQPKITGGAKWDAGGAKWFLGGAKWPNLVKLRKTIQNWV